MKQQLLKHIDSAELRPFQILDDAIRLEDYKPIDLSVSNTTLAAIDISNPDICQDYISLYLKNNGGKVAFGGYLEQRNLYGSNPNFNGAEKRNIHLGVDFWAPAGTKVHSPFKGKVHSFKNNATKGDYGPTIVLEHHFGKYSFYGLYGHLSIASLQGLYVGKKIDKDEVVGTLGTKEINVNYAPHLHLQFMLKMDGFVGDYPGVCTLGDLKNFTKNCPNPLKLLAW